jgi:hypothetical protein
MNEEPAFKPPSKADYVKYQTILNEVHEDIRLIGKSLLRLSKNLKRIHDKRLYLCGSYSSFEEFCKAELGKGRQYIYKLIQSHDVLQHLLVSGVAEQDLPETERLVREIRQLHPDNQVLVWKAVMKIKKNLGRPPTVYDVQAEAAKISGASKTIDRQQDELIKRFEGAARALRVSPKFEVLTPYYRNRLLTALQSIADNVQQLIAAFSSSRVNEWHARQQAEKEQEEQEEQE